MTPSEYLDAAKKAMGIESDYELAARFEIPRQYISNYRKTGAIDTMTAYKIAITLKLDPAQVVADLEGQREKNEKKRAFWASFTSRARIAIVAMGLSCTLGWSFSAMSGDDLWRLGGAAAMTASAVYFVRRKDA